MVGKIAVAFILVERVLTKKYNFSAYTLQYSYYQDMFSFLGSLLPCDAPSCIDSSPTSNSEESPHMFLSPVGNPALCTGLVFPTMKIVHVPK